ncbi:hypothetical protein AAFF_G00250770 [Aldrovandia affinis]|uniref:Uncharacterized protein n=1 Tax=Aldrovandia affinis TaxID=143900 RepID=A0AAD7RD23_9TELE|nr:hypothetical protein AAFF_G00250770 [Aldrovandia affinis]
MKSSEARRDSRCAENMERKPGSYKRQHCCRTFANVISFIFSVVSVAYCILLSVQTSEIRERVVELESGHGELLYHQARGFSMDQFNSLVRERVDQLLSQRSYEHLAKVRSARQAPADCSCPPGK